MITCGIDPGTTGAISIYIGVELICVYDMPFETKTSGKGHQVSATGLARILKAWGVKIACVESVHAMPGQGVVSVFGFGRSLGVIAGICAGLDIRIKYITPQEWKKSFNLIGTPKEFSRFLSKELFPYFSTVLRLQRHTDRADAILIGLYLKKRHYLS